MERFRWLVPTAVFLSVLVSGMTVPVSAAGPHSPEWTKGDFWEYEGTVDFMDQTYDMTVRYEVMAIEDVTVKDTTYSCYRAEATTEMSGGGTSLAMTLTAWYRTSDIAQVKMEMESFGSTVTMSYSPPIAIEWPLEVGKQWSGTSTVTTQSSYGVYEDQQYYEFVVESQSSITVPAGTFDAYAVNGTMAVEGGLMYYSAKVGNYIRMGAPGLFTPGSSIDLVDYKYQSAGGGILPEVTGISVLGVDLLWILLIIIAVVIIIALVLASRRRPPLPVEAPPQAGGPSMRAARPLPPPPTD